MSKTLVLKAEVRDKAGTKQAAKVRKAGRIPGVMYGHKQEPTAISLDAHDFIEGLHHGNRLIDVQPGKAFSLKGTLHWFSGVSYVS